MTERRRQKVLSRPNNIVDLYISGGIDNSRKNSRAVLLLDFFGVDDTEANIKGLIAAATEAPLDALSVDIVPYVWQRFHVPGEVIRSILERDFMMGDDSGVLVNFSIESRRILAGRAAVLESE